MYRKWLLAFIIFGSILAVAGFEYGDTWPYCLGPIAGWFGTFLSIIAAIGQYQEAKPYELHVTHADWHRHHGEFYITITDAHHGKGSGASVHTYRKTAHGFEEVICDISTLPDQSMRITVTQAFEGKIVVK